MILAGNYPSHRDNDMLPHYDHERAIHATKISSEHCKELVQELVVVHGALVHWYSGIWCTGTVAPFQTLVLVHAYTKQGWPEILKLRGAGLSIWGQKPLNFSPFCTVLHSLVQKTCSAAKTNVIENTHPWHQNNHPWHQEEAAGATCAPFQTPEPCSIVTPDNYSFCPCTRAGATKMQQCMYTKLALALKTPW